MALHAQLLSEWSVVGIIDPSGDDKFVDFSVVLWNEFPP
jgi:hypothetical protein